MVTRTVIRITSSEAEHWAAIAAAAAGDNSAAIKKANNEQSKKSKSSAATSDQKDVQQTKRRKKTLCSHPSCTNVPNIPRFSAGDMVQKMSYVALMDAIREEFYWDYVPITNVGAIMSMERMHQQGRLGKTGWNVLDAS
jgi:hypothetical protein